MSNRIGGAVFLDADRGILFIGPKTIPKSKVEWILDFSDSYQCLLDKNDTEVIEKALNMIILKKKLEEKTQDEGIKIEKQMIDISMLL